MAASWEQWLANTNVDRRALILLVSTSGEAIPSRLSLILDQRNIRCRRLATHSQKGLFMRASGISWTPETIVLDQQFDVKFASHARYAELGRDLTVILARLTAGGEG
jgi:hypothetical protein